jgi:hypothetical protein
MNTEPPFDAADSAAAGPPLKTGLAREIEVAFSLDTQSIGFRIAKWTVFAAITAAMARAGWLWQWLASILTLSLSVHFLYRWQTRAWTRPWGGWPRRGSPTWRRLTANPAQPPSRRD